MSKALNYILINFRIIIVLIILLALILLSGYEYSQEYQIQYIYDGIKFQTNNLESAIPINIKVNGIFLKGNFGYTNQFEGEIIIDGKMCYAQDVRGAKSNKYSFSKQKMSRIESDSFKGSIFIGDKMSEITITIDEPNSTVFSFMNGWMISAPCESRNQAIDISNKLIQKLHKDVLIE